ncbi:MAG: hypothetical protein N4A68_07555 [Maledivibacter sp.]|jgi:hypothetical protein|nr:hypothetical protein [Maledivibacter sp.]
MNADQIKRKMAENSRKWHTAKSQSERDKLHRDNINLSKKLDGASYDRDSGKWSVLKYDRGSRGSCGGGKEEVSRSLERKSYPSYGTPDYRKWQNELKQEFDRRSENNLKSYIDQKVESMKNYYDEKADRMDKDITDLSTRKRNLVNIETGLGINKMLLYGGGILAGLVVVKSMFD